MNTDVNEPTNGIEHNSTDNTKLSNFRKALPQFLAVGVKNILLFGYGLTIGFPTIVIPAIQGGQGRESTQHDDLILSKDEISWFSSINLLCVPLGCVFSGMITQPIGKRRAMQIINVPLLLSWILFHFSTNTYYLYAGLCLSGLSGGLMEAPVLTYVAEVTQPKFRGMLAASGSTCVILGVFIQFLLGTILKWRTIAAICTIFPIISIITLFLVPESPYWLLTKGRIEESQRSLAWLRGWVSTDKVEDEFNEMCNVLLHKTSNDDMSSLTNPKKSIFQQKLDRYLHRSFLVPYALVAYTFFVEHFSGKTTLQTYAVQIFHTLKAPIDKYYATVLLGAAELIGTVICVFLVHFTGKRPLVLVSAIGCGMGFLTLATYARYLNLVPGITVENVVANHSALDLDRTKLISSVNVSSLTVEESMNKYREFPEMIHYKRVLFVREVRDTTEYDYSTTFSSTDNSSSEYDYLENSSFATDATDEFTFTNENETDEGIFTTETSLNKTDLDYMDDEHNSTHMDVPISHPDENSEEIIPKHIVIQVPNVAENKYLWVPLTLLILSALFAHIGLRLIPWMLIGEVFPASIRSGASGISSGTGYVFGFLANKLFLRMLSTLTLPGTFWLYASVGLSGAAFFYFILPETEGRSLLEIEEHFSGVRSLNDKAANELHIDDRGQSADPIVIEQGMEFTQIDPMAGKQLQNLVYAKGTINVENSMNTTQL